MGDRAVITTKYNYENNGIGVYLHWCGSPSEVKAFLDFCKKAGYREPDEDDYGWARLVQTIANVMGSNGLSVGINTINNLDCENGDNGVYFIKGWEIIENNYYDDIDECIDEQEYEAMFKAICERQPYTIKGV